MCILFIAIEQHPDFPLIVAANRDEFFARPSRYSQFWEAHPDILGGLDLQAGGSWMGVNRRGYLAALTNIRNPRKTKPQAISRGHLVSQYLQDPGDDYLHLLKDTRQRYNGYNLLFGTLNKLQVYNNHLDQCSKLSKGVYGLSNASLNSPWPKVNKGVQALQAYCSKTPVMCDDQLFELLQDSSKAPDPQLPSTGIPLDWERQLSAIFVRGQDYGTRSSTVLKISRNRQLFWQERNFNSQAECINLQNYQFTIN